MPTNVRYRILIVEDELLVALDLAEGLRSLNHDVVATCDSADDAVKLAASEKPDAVLMDVRLKGDRDGISAAAEIRASRDVPILFLTAHNDPVTMERIFAVEPDSYITKPCTVTTLDTELRLALFRKEAQRRRRERQREIEGAAEQASERLVVVDQDCRVTFANAAALGGRGSIDELAEFTATLPTRLRDELAVVIDSVLSSGSAATRNMDGLELRVHPIGAAPAVEGAVISVRAHTDDHDLIRICSWTKDVFNVDEGVWVSIADYLTQRYGLRFTHGISPRGLAMFELQD